MSTLDRRRFLLGVAGTLALPTRLAMAGDGSGGERRFVLVILRGALDGLAAMPPLGDPHYADLRGEIAIPGGPDGARPLDATFALHPSLAWCHAAYGRGELLAMHAVATPYRERSHFDAQDVLENGMARPHASRDGWLNRAVASLPRRGRGEAAGVAISQNLPLVLRGDAAVISWAPSGIAATDDDTLSRLADLYAGDPLLSQRLAEALAADEVAGGAMPGAGRRAGRDLAIVARVAGEFLTRPEGPRIAVLDAGGWDTHANQGAAQGALASRLAALDAGLAALAERLGDAWARTAVMVVTEFGRTARVNGTRGTDHGTGAVALLLGGAVAGGRVLSDWPSLAPQALHEGRDLRPTTDLRSVMKGVLRDHLGVAPRVLEASVFPDSRSAPAMAGLIRA